MTFFSAIAPDLRPIETDVRIDDYDNDNKECLSEFPFNVQSYVSQLEDKLYCILKIDNWNWRIAFVGCTIVRIVTIPFYIFEACIAGITAVFAFLHCRDLNDPNFRHLTCWMGENIAEMLMSCVAPFVLIVALCIGGQVREIFDAMIFKKI